jgi:hypothetical protein
MNYRYLVGFLVCACWLACGRAIEPFTMLPQGGFVLSDSGYKSMEGMLDGRRVSMHLFHNGHALYGSYYGHEFARLQWIEGTIESEGIVRFWANEDTFQGRFLTPTHLIGRRLGDWTKGMGILSLQESLDDVAQLTLQELEAEYHFPPCIPPQHPENAVTWNEDTMWSEIDVRRLVVSLADSAVAGRIQGAIDTAIYSDHGIYGEAYFARLPELARDRYYYSLDACRVIMNAKGILSLSVLKSMSKTDIFMEDGHNIHLNFDLKTRKQIRLSDILRPGYQDGLNAVGAEYFDKMTHRSEILGDDAGPMKDFHMPDDFAITPLGLRFDRERSDGYFDSWNDEMFIPYGDLMPLIREDGPLRVLLE